jgi:hypothetical protein
MSTPLLEVSKQDVSSALDQIRGTGNVRKKYQNRLVSTESVISSQKDSISKKMFYNSDSMSVSFDGQPTLQLLDSESNVVSELFIKTPEQIRSVVDEYLYGVSLPSSGDDSSNDSGINSYYLHLSSASTSYKSNWYLHYGHNDSYDDARYNCFIRRLYYETYSHYENPIILSLRSLIRDNSCKQELIRLSKLIPSGLDIISKLQLIINNLACDADYGSISSLGEIRDLLMKICHKTLSSGSQSLDDQIKYQLLLVLCNYVKRERVESSVGELDSFSSNSQQYLSYQISQSMMSQEVDDWGSAVGIQSIKDKISKRLVSPDYANSLVDAIQGNLSSTNIQSQCVTVESSSSIQEKKDFIKSLLRPYSDLNTPKNITNAIESLGNSKNEIEKKKLIASISLIGTDNDPSVSTLQGIKDLIYNSRISIDVSQLDELIHNYFYSLSLAGFGAEYISNLEYLLQYEIDCSLSSQNRNRMMNKLTELCINSSQKEKRNTLISYLKLLCYQELDSTSLALIYNNIATQVSRIQDILNVLVPIKERQIPNESLEFWIVSYLTQDLPNDGTEVTQDIINQVQYCLEFLKNCNPIEDRDKYIKYIYNAYQYLSIYSNKSKYCEMCHSLTGKGLSDDYLQSLWLELLNLVSQEWGSSRYAEILGYMDLLTHRSLDSTTAEYFSNLVKSILNESLPESYYNRCLEILESIVSSNSSCVSASLAEIMYYWDDSNREPFSWQIESDFSDLIGIGVLEEDRKFKYQNIIGLFRQLSYVSEEEAELVENYAERALSNKRNSNFDLFHALFPSNDLDSFISEYQKCSHSIAVSDLESDEKSIAWSAVGAASYNGRDVIKSLSEGASLAESNQVPRMRVFTTSYNSVNGYPTPTNIPTRYSHCGNNKYSLYGSHKLCDKMERIRYSGSFMVRDVNTVCRVNIDLNSYTVLKVWDIRSSAGSLKLNKLFRSSVSDSGILSNLLCTQKLAVGFLQKMNGFVSLSSSLAIGLRMDIASLDSGLSDLMSLLTNAYSNLSGVIGMELGLECSCFHVSFNIVLVNDLFDSIPDWDFSTAGGYSYSALKNFSLPNISLGIGCPYTTISDTYVLSL